MKSMVALCFAALFLLDPQHHHQYILPIQSQPPRDHAGWLWMGWMFLMYPRRVKDGVLYWWKSLWKTNLLFLYSFMWGRCHAPLPQQRMVAAFLYTALTGLSVWDMVPLVARLLSSLAVTDLTPLLFRLKYLLLASASDPVDDSGTSSIFVFLPWGFVR